MSLAEQRTYLNRNCKEFVMLTANSLSNIRVVVLALTGFVCLLYAVLALLAGSPDPISPWIPGVFGVSSAAIIAIAFVFSGSRNAEMASDEGFFSDYSKAAGTGYWTALFLYPVFAVALSSGWVSYPVAFATMGTLTGAAFLLPLVWFDLRGRG